MFINRTFLNLSAIWLLKIGKKTRWKENSGTPYFGLKWRLKLVILRNQLEMGSWRGRKNKFLVTQRKFVCFVVFEAFQIIFWLKKRNCNSHLFQTLRLQSKSPLASFSNFAAGNKNRNSHFFQFLQLNLKKLQLASF